jgi:hypothetical protein
MDCTKAMQFDLKKNGIEAKLIHYIEPYMPYLARLGFTGKVIDYIDFYRTDLERLHKSMLAYYPVNFTTIVCAFAIEYKTTPPLQIYVATLFIWLWIYGIHRLYHNIPSTGIFYYLNTHIAFHHAEHKTIPPWLDLTIETIQNMVWFAILYFLQEVSGVHLVPSRIILLSMLVYVSVHIVNYSMIGSDKHTKQHENPHINYGPDFLDHMFGTNSDDSFEDMIGFVPNTILACLFILYLT